MKKKNKDNPAYRLGEKLFVEKDRDNFFILLDKLAKEYHNVYVAKKYITNFHPHDLLCHQVRGVCYIDYLMMRINDNDIKTISHLLSNVNFTIRGLIMDKMKKNKNEAKNIEIIMKYKDQLVENY